MEVYFTRYRWKIKIVASILISSATDAVWKTPVIIEK